MDRANLIVAMLSALVGVIALGMALSSGRLVNLSSVLGLVLLANAFVRFQLARER
ncbi:MAG: hypothetical protein O3A10_04380 [Chloroflexi bacterium]|nr:hypothetical protein [Chloroflexota bacterium]MDA1146801.1 hypothetical protein [Chloroflexota bacterium]